MSASTVLVAGGAGYIGSHACKALSRAGYLPVTYDSLERGNAWAVRWGPLERGNILDRARLDRVFARWNPVAVMHFAALAYVDESVRRPLDYWRNNVAGTLTLLEASVAAGIRSFVFSSTCATYGMPETSPISEHHRQNPVSPYGATKLSVERMLRHAASAHGFGSVSLRYFNAAGADPDGEIGEWHEPETHLIPIVTRAALEGGVVRINGVDYATPDGTCVRDFVHVGDIANAHVCALRHLLNGGETLFLNLGTGRGYSVREVIAAVERVSGRSVRTDVGPRRPGDPPTLVADATAAQTVLGWQPQFRDLEPQVRTAWDWFQRARTALPTPIAYREKVDR